MARPRKHIVAFTNEEVELLKNKLTSPKTNRTIKARIRILLLLDTAHNNDTMPYETIAKNSGTSLSTVRKIVSDYSKGGLEPILEINRKSGSDTARLKVDKSLETKIIRIARGLPPGGQSRWTLRSLAEICRKKLKKSLSKDTIRRTLGKKDFSIEEIPIAATIPRYDVYKEYEGKNPDKVREIIELQKKIICRLKKGCVNKKDPSDTIRILANCVNSILPQKELSEQWEIGDQKNLVISRENLIRRFLLPIGFECHEYLDAPDVMSVIGSLLQKKKDELFNYEESKTKEIKEIDNQYKSACMNESLDYNNYFKITADLECKRENLKYDIIRKKLSIPDFGDFIKIDRAGKLEEIDRNYFSKKKKTFAPKQFYPGREYWKALKGEIIRSFPEIKWNRMLQYTEEDYCLHIPIEDWWWGNKSSQPPIEKLYYALIDNGWMYNVSLDSFIRIFSFPINLNWWHPIIWEGTYKKSKSSSGNLTMLWYLISAMRKWDWFQEYCDLQRNPELSPTRLTREILTQDDRDKISKFFLTPSGEIIKPKSLRFSKDCNPSLFYIEEIIKKLR